MVLPGLHEIGTAFSSIGKLVTGDVKGAGEVWEKYSEESVIGSGVRSAYHGITGDKEEAARIAKGMGRATGRALTGGGLLSEIPVFKELDKAGKSLGDVLGGGDTESARKRWTEEYVEEYCDGSNWAKAGVQAATVAGGIGVTLLTGGLATAPFYAAVSGAGAGLGVANNAANQGIDIAAGKKDKFDSGELVGSGLTGGAMAAIGGKVNRAMDRAVLKSAQNAELAGTGQTMFTDIDPFRDIKYEVPRVSNPGLNAENLARISSGSRNSGASSAASSSSAVSSSSAAASSSTSAASQATAASAASHMSNCSAASSAYSEISRVSKAYSNAERLRVARLVEYAESQLQHARRHLEELVRNGVARGDAAARELLNGRPANGIWDNLASNLWKNAMPRLFDNILNHPEVILVDVTYRGIGDFVAFVLKETRDVVLFAVRLGRDGKLKYHFHMAYKAGEAQMAHILSQAGRLN